jgi:cyclopropane fatty-acyl-phospholipid synthase-like methyltransferase
VTQPDAGWDEAYQREQPPPWDIGRPQPAFAALAREGALAGELLDAGCGTGENSLFAATFGAHPFGVDLSPSAVASARRKAAERGIDAQFEAGDILEYALPSAAFDNALDSGLFHSFSDDERPRYTAALSGALRPGARLFLACFSERQPGDWGPRRVTEAELRAAFSDGWEVERIEPMTFEINPVPDADSVDAWLGVFRRT